MNCSRRGLNFSAVPPARFETLRRCQYDLFAYHLFDLLKIILVGSFVRLGNYADTEKAADLVRLICDGKTRRTEANFFASSER